METKKNNKRKDNHVVVGLGLWGRGHGLNEALKNGRLKIKSYFVYYIFKNDNWDIMGDGSVRYQKEDLIHSETFNIEKL